MEKRIILQTRWEIVVCKVGYLSNPEVQGTSLQLGRWSGQLEGGAEYGRRGGRGGRVWRWMDCEGFSEL